MGSVSKLLNGVLAWRNEWITKTNHWLGLRMVSEEEWLRLKAYEFSLIELVRVREKESKP